jgi:alpha-galactosidase
VSDTLSGRNTGFNKIVYNIKDLWTKKELGNTQKLLSAQIPGHDVLMLGLTRK